MQKVQGAFATYSVYWSSCFHKLPVKLYILSVYRFASARVVLLEFSQYLENYLWPNFNPKVASKEHVMSIVTMVNEKFSERVPAWEVGPQIRLTFVNSVIIYLNYMYLLMSIWHVCGIFFHPVLFVQSEFGIWLVVQFVLVVNQGMHCLHHTLNVLVILVWTLEKSWHFCFEWSVICTDNACLALQLIHMLRNYYVNVLGV